MTDLVERVAAIIRNGAGAVLHQHERDAIARAIIPLVLEDAAKVAERESDEWPDNGFGADCVWWVCRDIAAAIRAEVRHDAG